MSEKEPMIRDMVKQCRNCGCVGFEVNKYGICPICEAKGITEPQPKPQKANNKDDWYSRW